MLRFELHSGKGLGHTQKELSPNFSQIGTETTANKTTKLKKKRDRRETYLKKHIPGFFKMIARHINV